MPTLIMTKLLGDLDGSIKAKVTTFLQKLAEDDTVPGLHIEPMHHPIDPRVRTGRVDHYWRAVLFRLDDGGERHYLVYGVWGHNEATERARTTRLTVNPVNGLPQFDALEPATGETGPAAYSDAPQESLARPAAATTIGFLESIGYTRADLIERLGIPDAIARAAMYCADEDAMVSLAVRHDGWIGLSLVDLASGLSIDDIAESLGMAEHTADHTPPEPGEEGADAATIRSLSLPGAGSQFTFIADQDELRRVIDGGDLEAWRIFLHPDQQRLVDVNYSGAARISGGAGTGKTVVLVHRAHRLLKQNPSARLVLTTFTTNLAQSLGDLVTRLDPGIGLQTKLGASGLYVAGIDSIAAAVIRQAGGSITSAVETVLGEARPSLTGRTPSVRWRDIAKSTEHSLSSDIANETFLEAEYSLVVLANRITDEASYLRVRRRGRGVRLDRKKRVEVWSLIQAYRAQSRIDESIDFAEAAAIAAAHLQDHPSERPADHVLVDEAQDLTPPQLQLLRELADPGINDLMLAEDSHQRIYGPRVVLGHVGIAIVGRSRRLTLNYRTTAQNLAYAVNLLEGGDYTDLEGEAESTGYHSARSGPEPKIITVDGLAAELTAVVSQVDAWLTDGTPAGAIAVLAPDRHQRDRVANRLAEAGVQAVAVDRNAVPTDRVTVMTMHRAKGMEFAKVMLTDIGHVSDGQHDRLASLDESERADEELRMRSLHYVAATRARDELIVIQRS